MTPLRQPEAAREPVTAAERTPTPEPPAPEPAREETGEQVDFVSPFEDELDVPAFMRKRARDEGEEDAETPAFLRRSAD